MSKPNSKSDGQSTGQAEIDLAVALGYDLDGTAPPKILAKGKGELARQIFDLALANGVRVRRDADLVGLLSALEVDQDIPVEAFAAVAEILAYIYRANGRLPNPQDQETKSS